MFSSGHEGNKGQLSPYYEGRECIKGIVNDDCFKAESLRLCEKRPP